MLKCPGRSVMQQLAGKSGVALRYVEIDNPLAYFKKRCQMAAAGIGQICIPGYVNRHQRTTSFTAVMIREIFGKFGELLIVQRAYFYEAEVIDAGLTKVGWITFQ